jgi:hypothetical protein
MAVTKGLVLIHREESAKDFVQIAKQMQKIDPSIAVMMFSDFANLELAPPIFRHLPLLYVYMVNPPPENIFHPYPKVWVKNLNKLEEYEHFKVHQLPCLPIEKFEWGMSLDKKNYGDWVVIKPQNLQSSGLDINMIPTEALPKLKLSDFPEKHLIHQDGYFVQKFVRTGECPIFYRVMMFMGSVMLSYRCVQNAGYPNVDTDLKTLLQTSVAGNLRGNRRIDLVKDEAVNALAVKVAESLPQMPLLGVDIMPDAETGELIVIETNSGGNTWAFSNQPSLNLRSVIGVNKMIKQYKPWEVAARALVNKVNAFAGYMATE